MNSRNSGFAAAVVVALLAAGCGGGGGGGGGSDGASSAPTSPPPQATVTITPKGPVTASVAAGEPVAAVLEGTWQATNLPAGGVVYLRVNDPSGTFANPAVQAAPGNGTFRYDLTAKDPVLSGDHTGQIEITACRDAACAQTWGNAVRVDFRVAVATLGEWQTINRDATHTSFVPTNIDPTRLQVAWEWDAPAVPGAAELYVGRPATTQGSLILVAGATMADGSQRNTMISLNELDGSLRWNRRVADGIRAVAPASNGELAYLVTVGNDTLITALDGKTGKVAFTYAQTTSPTAAIVAPTEDRGQLFFFAGPDGNELHAIDARNGSPLWTLPRYELQLTTPTLDDGGHLYFRSGATIDVVDRRGSGYSAPFFDYDSDGTLLPGTVTMAYGPHADLIGHSFTPARGARLSSFNVIGGAKNWITQYSYNSFFAVGNSAVYAQRAGQLPPTLEAMDEKTSRILWTWVAPGTEQQTRFINNVVATNNVVFVSTENSTSGRGFLWGIDAKTGQTLWRQDNGGYVVISGSRTVYVVSENGSNLDHIRAMRVQ
ncbi:PQQ-binding-like beta-propeller repeat protein [Lysobacter soli]|uniref:outer membrane protein assembly factor BamB family protein n=1 Tax=Lysobacter soli TaxID=453783 RepID=UPI00209CD261|nr:PQQ-binding-like beta-propeller repeat protein [Lysobacter soli]UTA53819.1 PQQ-binding-like beta-propeller repeat protein [Lysobacter soli]